MKTVETIQEIINTLSPIPENKWCTGVLDGPDDTHCAVGHLMLLGKYHLLDDSCGIPQKLQFKVTEGGACWGVEPINDGFVEEYQQPTPKARVLAALHDLLEKEQTQPAVEEVQQIVNNPKIEVYETV